MVGKSESKLLPKARDEAEKRTTSFPFVIREIDARVTSGIVLSIFVLLFSLLIITSFLQKSPTVDEPVHLLAGYSYLKWGDFRVNPEHPPLAKVLAALPLLALDVRDPRPSSPDWELIPDSKPGPPTENVAHNMFFVINDADTLFFYAKLPMVGLGIVLGISVFLWAKKLYGLTAAVTALFMYGLDPNILAHSQVVHTDIPFSTFFFISTYFFWEGLNRFSWTNLLLTALFFGLASITKYSFSVIVPIWGILGLLWIFSSRSQQWRVGNPHTVSSRWQKAALLTGIFICALITAYLFTWAVYGFRFNAIPGEDRHLTMAHVMPERPPPLLGPVVSFVTQYHLFPEAWVYGQLHVLKHLRRPTYLLDQISDDGFWFYYPVAFAVKTPLPTVILLLGTLGIWLFKRKDWLPRLFLFIPVVLYFSLAVWSRINIGLRHILPIYPFLFVLIGGAVAELWRGKLWIKKWSLILLGVWYLWSSLSIYPHYLAYFNELVGGPKSGHKTLLDSNLDWGQDLRGLKRWMDNNQVKSIQFLYFGIAEPKYYGIDAFYLPGSLIIHKSSDSGTFEVPEYLAVSGTLFYGREIYLNQEQEEILRSFRLGEPIANIGYSILIYKLDLADPQVYYTVGYILARRDQLSKAVDLFHQALRIQPEFAEAHEALAQTLALQGKEGEAIKHHNEALRIMKPDPAATKRQ